MSLPVNVGAPSTYWTMNAIELRDQMVNLHYMLPRFLLKRVKAMRDPSGNNIKLCDLLELNIKQLCDDNNFEKIKWINDNFEVFFQRPNRPKALALTSQDSAISSASQISDQKLRGTERMRSQFELALATTNAKAKEQAISALKEREKSAIGKNKIILANLIAHMKKPKSLCTQL